MKVMRFVKRASALVLVSGVLAVCSLSAFDAPQVSALAVNTSGSQRNGIAQATFKIEVTNREASAVTNVDVTFDDGVNVSIGDVDAGKTRTSEAVTRTVNLNDMGSRNTPIKVTLKFSLDGTAHEVAVDLTLGRR